MKRKKSNGFTLAEVLIVVGIIGVVAALTIPTVIKNNERKELEVGFKKAHSTISQAILYLKNENGNVYGAYKVGNTGANDLKTDLMKYFNVLDQCIPDNSCEPPDSTYYANSTNKNVFLTTAHFIKKFYTEDGMLISTFVSSSGLIYWIYVDTNGYNKGPNRAGYDMFSFQVMDPTKESYLLPGGAIGTYYATSPYCSITNTMSYNGFNCAKMALEDPNYFKNLP